MDEWLDGQNRHDYEWTIGWMDRIVIICMDEWVDGQNSHYLYG